MVNHKKEGLTFVQKKKQIKTKKQTKTKGKKKQKSSQSVDAEGQLKKWSLLEQIIHKKKKGNIQKNLNPEEQNKKILKRLKKQKNYNKEIVEFSDSNYIDESKETNTKMKNINRELSTKQKAKLALSVLIDNE